MFNPIEVRCTAEQADITSGSQLTVDTVLKLLIYFNESKEQMLSQCQDYTWAESRTLGNIFTMGYISGVRAERSRKK